VILGLIIGNRLGVGYVCFQITNMGLSTMFESREQIQRKVVQLVIHNMVKGGWKVTFHNRQKNITSLMHKVGDIVVLNTLGYTLGYFNMLLRLYLKLF